MQKAGGLDQAEAFLRGILEQRVYEIVKRAAETGQAGILGFGKVTGFDQRVAVAQFRRHLFEQHALADAIGRDRDVAGAEGLDHFLEHLGGDGDKGHALGRDATAHAQFLGVVLGDILGRCRHRLAAHPVFMQHVERVALAVHVDPGDGAP